MEVISKDGGHASGVKPEQNSGEGPLKHIILRVRPVDAREEELFVPQERVPPRSVLWSTLSLCAAVSSRGAVPCRVVVWWCAA